MIHSKGNILKYNHIPSICNLDFSTINNDIIDIINNECDVVFLMLQDCIRQEDFPIDYEGLISFLDKLKKPVVVMGIGANSFPTNNENPYDFELHSKLSESLKNFLHCLSYHCESIGVRGDFTKYILNKLGINNVSVIGCPTYYEMGPNRKLSTCTLNDIDQIVLSHETGFDFLSDNYQACQDMQEAKLINAIVFNKFDTSGLRLVELNRLINKKYFFSSSVIEWKRFLSKFKLCIGGRVHGSIAALNSNVPAICMNHDARAREMCSLFGIPLLYKNNYIDFIELSKYFNFELINSRYPTLFDNFKNFLETNHLKLVNNYWKNEISQPRTHLYKNFDKSNVILSYNFYHDSLTRNNIKLVRDDLHQEFNNFFNKIISSFSIRTRNFNLKKMEKFISFKVENGYKVIRLIGRPVWISSTRKLK